jgi:hypothetical protein
MLFGHTSLKVQLSSSRRGMMITFDLSKVLASQIRLTPEMGQILEEQFEQVYPSRVATVSVTQCKRRLVGIPALPRDGTLYEVILQDADGKNIHLDDTWFLHVMKKGSKVSLLRSKILAGTLAMAHPPRRR